MDAPKEIIDNIIRLYEEGDVISILNSSDELLAKYPDNATIHNLLGAGFSQLNEVEKSLYHLQKAIEIEPFNYLILNNLGNVFIDINEYQKAIDVMNSALNIRSDFAEGYNTLGLALYKSGDIDGSIINFQKAVELKHNLLSAYNNLGISYKKKNKMDSAFSSFVNAIKINPNSIEPLHNLASIINNVHFGTNRSDLHEIMIMLLEKNNCIDPNEISKSIINLLKLDPFLNFFFNNYFFIKKETSLQNLISNFENYPLFLKLMRVSLICDLDIERILKDLRSSILSSIFNLKSNQNLLNFQSALALHCFTNEYIYCPTLEENKELDNLENEIKKKISKGKQPETHFLLCIASYKSLNQYDWSSFIINNTSLNDVFKRQIQEPNLEKRLELKTNNPQMITDKVSKIVKQQYEENPYPRWINSHFRLFPLSIAEVIAETQIKLNNSSIININDPKILVAGCGTGQEAIHTATLYKNSNVLAIDLSNTSLKYAKRKTKELGIKNIEYIQYDILDLKKLNKKFDIIICAGVLHHMNNPLKGWSTLSSCLNDGGLMYIGLYSKFARKEIINLRNEISEKKIKSNNTKIKSYRALLCKSISEKSNWLTHLQDFYSTSMFRDLLFHTQEKQFTLQEIKKSISDLGLTFCGFEDFRILDLFKKDNNSLYDLYNLDKWHLFETKNPHIFGGMYQFWCQKNREIN